MSFRQAIDQHLQKQSSGEKRADALPMTTARTSNTTLSDVIACLERRVIEGAEIERIAADTLPLLEEIRMDVADQARVNQIIARIDALRAAMNAVGATYDLMTQLTQASQMKRFEADRRLSAEKLDALERQRRQGDRDIANVTSMRQAARDFQQLLSETIQSLRMTARAA